MRLAKQVRLFYNLRTQVVQQMLPRCPLLSSAKWDKDHNNLFIDFYCLQHEDGFGEVWEFYGTSTAERHPGLAGYTSPSEICSTCHQTWLAAMEKET